MTANIPQRLTDKTEIRRRLNAEREWSLYALADLDDGMFELCDWWGLGDGLALVFRGISIRPIFVLGDAACTRALLEALPEPSGYLNLQAHQVEGARGIYSFRGCHEMARMLLGEFQPRESAVEPLSARDVDEIERLYTTGDGGGIAFAPVQVETGFFRGIRRHGELVAVAGVQVVSRRESVAAVGNIFTRPDCRGQGLAQTLTSAVVAALRDAGIQTIGLNVERANAPAVHAYERIGFRTRLHYYEGPAERLLSTPDRSPSRTPR
jgi:ribosomal protein S18 acetylase RimI-like enzyme